jgi:hypothetical protein
MRRFGSWPLLMLKLLVPYLSVKSLPVSPEKRNKETQAF